MSVLIVTMPGDRHAHAVRWAIERLGGEARILYPADLCDGARWTYDPAGSMLETEYGAERAIVDLDAQQSVWMRRPQEILPQVALEDEIERAITEEDFGILARSVYSLLGRGRFTVNPRDASRAAGAKPFQFAVASAVGLEMPRTLIGNSPEAILDFHRVHDGRVVFKPFRSPVWQSSKGPRMVPTTRLTRDMLLTSDLAAAPGIFQEMVAKRVEIRATIMGRTVFAWQKSFEDRNELDLDVDWRFMFRNARHELHELPGEVRDRCFALLDQLGLVFGCFDFVIDDEGRYLFLEVNPQGQWLWGDSMIDGLHQLEGMARFLLSCDPQFSWSGDGSISLADFPAEDFEAASRAEAMAHHGDLRTFAHHRVSFPVRTASEA